MASDSPLALGGRVKQGALHEQEVLVYPAQPSTLVWRCLFGGLLELVDVDSIAIDCWAQNQVGSLVFDLDVTEAL